jgi:hypothetical protein
MIQKCHFTKSEVAINAFVAPGNSTSELANKGIIEGITYTNTISIASNKNTKIIVGYVSAPFTFFFKLCTFFKSSLSFHNDSTNPQICSHASIIDTSAVVNTSGIFFIALEKESQLEIYVINSIIF